MDLLSGIVVGLTIGLLAGFAICQGAFKRHTSGGSFEGPTLYPENPAALPARRSPVEDLPPDSKLLWAGLRTKGPRFNKAFYDFNAGAK